MALVHSTSPIVTNGLVLALDAANRKSYPGTGTTWTDLSGNGNNGTLVNGPTYNSVNSGSIVFDGTNDYVSLPSNLDTILTGDLTMEVVIAMPNPLLIQFGFYFAGVMGIYGDGNYYRESNIQVSNTGNVSNPSTFDASVSFLNQSGDTGNSIGFGGFSFSSTPRVLSYTLSGTTATTYVNGSFVETKTITKYTKPADANVEIGWVNNTANYGYYRGNLFVSRIYNRALTAAEIQQNFNALRGRFGI
jgi:hypothetical protein